MVWISQFVSIVFTSSFLDHVIRVSEKSFFHSKKKSLTIELWYFRDIILARDQVFFAQFLLIDIKHDTVFKCGKVSFCCLFLFFNGVNKSLRKTVGNLVSLILTLKKIVGKNIDHSGQLSPKIATLKIPGKQFYFE